MERKKGFLLEHLKLYKESVKDKDKRKNFVFLFTVIIKMTKAFGYGDQNVYVDYFPVAEDKKGDYWLNQVKGIKNPYPGKKIPECGELKKEI